MGLFRFFLSTQKTSQPSTSPSHCRLFSVYIYVNAKPQRQTYTYGICSHKFHSGTHKFGLMNSYRLKFEFYSNGVRTKIVDTIQLKENNPTAKVQRNCQETCAQNAWMEQNGCEKLDLTKKDLARHIPLVRDPYLLQPTLLITHRFHVLHSLQETDRFRS